MKDAQDGPAYGRTNWRRFGLAAAVPTAAAGFIVFGMANGAIAASFDVTGKPFKISASHLTGTGFAQYGSSVKTTGGKEVPVAMSGIARAELTNLCQSVHVTGTPFSLIIHAGTEKDHPAVAENLLIGMTELTGDTVFDGIDIGKDASLLKSGGADAHGAVGSFGQEATTVNIDNLHQSALSTTASTFHLTNLSMKVDLDTSGKNAPAECF